MFSLLSLKRAYVVTAGRLVGVVAVSELTKGNFFSFIYTVFVLARNGGNTYCHQTELNYKKKTF